MIPLVLGKPSHACQLCGGTKFNFSPRLPFCAGCGADELSASVGFDVSQVLSECACPLGPGCIAIDRGVMCPAEVVAREIAAQSEVHYE